MQTKILPNFSKAIRRLLLLPIVLLLAMQTIKAQTVYGYTGILQTYTVPAGINKLQVKLYGAQGRDANIGGVGGKGAYVIANLTVTPGATLNIYIGGQNGYNGGGAAGTGVTTSPSGSAGNGGGATDIRIGGTALSNRVMVAGGGGGGGQSGKDLATNGASAGGNGGISNAAGSNGAPSTNASSLPQTGGSGGTPTAGGTNGSGCSSLNGTPGNANGTGGNGPTFVQFTPPLAAAGAGGGGGGGYVNGGGGGGGAVGSTSCIGNSNTGGGGGAGGSNYLDPILTSASSITNGFQIANGSVEILPILTLGNALNFDGTDDYVDLASNITNLATANFTLEAWVKTTTTGVGQGIITCSNGNTTWEDGEKSLYIASDGKPNFVGYNNNYIVSTQAVNDGSWHHVAVVWTYSGSGTAGTGKIYIDGIDKSGSSNYAANSGNVGTFKIGSPNYYSGEAPNFFNGSIDEVRIWNVARTATEVQTNMSLELAGTEAGLKAYYKLNQALAAGTNAGWTIAFDATTNNNNGTLNNFALTGATSNWVTGTVPSAAATTNTNLSALTTTAGTITPVFAAATIAYTASVSNATTSVTVTPTKSDANANIQIRVNAGTYTTLASGAASSALSLNVGSNTIDVQVTAQDGTTVKTYTITVTRPANTLNNLNLTSSNSSPAAYSLRLLSSTYTGFAINVRRSNDNATQDIGFVAGNLDTASLKTFVGGNSGFVTIWYDQSGYGRNATQATLASQPSIVSAGSIIRKNTVPAVYFNTQSLATSAFSGTYSSGFTLAICGGVNANTTYSTFGAKTFGNNPSPFDSYNSLLLTGNGSGFATGTATLTNGINAASGFSQWIFSADASTMTNFRNGSANGTGAVTAYTDTDNTPLILGSRADAVTSLNGWISEFVSFGSKLSITDRQTTETAQKAYYFSANADLSALTTTAGTLTPSFAAATIAYTASVNTASITVTPTQADANATIQVRVNSGSYATVTSGSASSALSLNVGTNTVDVKVTAQDGTTIKTYTITVTRGYNYLDNAGLSTTTSRGAYSLRKLSSAYTGSAIKVRRASDNAEATIAFDATGTISATSIGTVTAVGSSSLTLSSTVAFSSFYTGTDVSVMTWYDQSGYANDITQTTTSLMPKVVSTGVLNLLNGKATLSFSGTSMDIPISSSLLNVQGSIAAVHTQASLQGNYSAIVSWPSGVSIGFGPLASAGLFGLYSTNAPNGAIIAGLVSTNTMYASNSTWTGSNASVTESRNKTVTSGSLGTRFTGTGNGYLGNNGNAFTGNVPELVIFSTALTTTDRQALENNQFANYASTNADLSSLTTSAGTLTPSFAAATIAYTASVSNATTSVTVTPTVSYAAATVQVRANSGTYATVTSGGLSSALALNVGSNTIDVKVTAQDGTTIKTYTITVTRPFIAPGNALNFNGSNNYVTGTSTALPLGNNARTIEAWVNPGVVQNGTIFNWGNGSVNNRSGILYINGYLYFVGQSNDLQGTIALTVGKWSHVAATFDGTTLKLYVNGVLDVSATKSLNTTGSTFRLGVSSSSLNEYFNGSIDEVRVWNVAKTQTQLQADMFNVISGSTTNLVAYYNFDNGTAGGTNTGVITLTDQTSNAQTGTLTNFTLTTGNSSNWITSTAWNTWTGTTSNSFATATNWSLGTVPTTTDNIVIPTGASNLPVSITGTQAVNMASIQASASATVTGTLQIAAPVYNSGTLTATAGTIELNGTTAQTIAASTFAGNTVQNVTINNTGGVTLSGALNITGTLTPTLGTLTTGGFLTLKSDATGTARIAPVVGAISGNVTVERYIPAGNRAYRLLTPGVTTASFIKANWQEGATSSTSNPVTGYGTHITGSTTDQTNGFDGTLTGNPSLYQFSNAGQTWGSIANTNATTLKAGNAYRLLVRGNRAVDLTVTASPSNTATTLRATGTLLTGDIVFGYPGNGTNTVGMPTLNTTVGGLTAGFSLVGNPYVSPVNWDNVYLDASGLADYYYTWDPTRSLRGAYVYWDKSDAAYTGPAGSAINQHIQPGQAIFVKATTATPVLTFKESRKSSTFTNVFRTQSTLTGKMNIGLTNTALLANNNGFDGASILFADSFSSAIDGEDAPKITNQDENLSVFSSSTNLMKESRPTVTSNDTVQLRVWQLASNSYILTFNAEQFAGNREAYLLDGYLNSSSPISIAGNTHYPFTTNAAAASFADTRFSIVFKSTGALPVSITALKAFQKNAGVQVEWNTVNETNMAAYEVEKSADATTFTKAGTVTATGGLAYNWYDASPVNGNNYYRIKMVDKTGTFKYTQVVNVKIGGIKNVFSIVGNPIRNKTITLQMENVEKGSYTVNVFNNLGQQVASKTINHAGGSATETIALGNAAAGTYQLSVIGNNVKETRTIIVE